MRGAVVGDLPFNRAFMLYSFISHGKNSEWVYAALKVAISFLLFLSRIEQPKVGTGFQKEPFSPGRLTAYVWILPTDSRLSNKFKMKQWSNLPKWHKHPNSPDHGQAWLSISFFFFFFFFTHFYTNTLWRLLVCYVIECCRSRVLLRIWQWELVERPRKREKTNPVEEQVFLAVWPANIVWIIEADEQRKVMNSFTMPFSIVKEEESGWPTSQNSAQYEWDVEL